MIVQGKYNSATIYTDNVDSETLGQIYNMLNIPCFADTRIAIMPDVHMGKGSVVGFTMSLNNYINPNVIGVDIGCGIVALNIGRSDIDLEKFDEFIHARIPSGSNVHTDVQSAYTKSDSSLDELIKKVAPKEYRRIYLSVGSLGGGNHFLELDRDDRGNVWLVIHSGSRNLGMQVCTYHQNQAKKVIKKQFDGASAYHNMEFLTLENGGDEYLADMKIAQAYAEENRSVMARIIIEEFFQQRYQDCDRISSVHNYINLDDRIVRKGAISAHEGERVIIPLNMRDGCLIAKGKGNPSWNYSAPHGAGRLLKRNETKDLISLEDYQESMKDIFSTCVSEKTLDESPMAYKDPAEIRELIDETVEIESTVKPIYNFKA